MRVANRVMAFALAATSGVTFAAELASNRELRQLEHQDQAARIGDVIDWNVVGPADGRRRKQVADMVRSARVRTAEDYYNAAMIYQHGDSVDDIRLAYAFATIAAMLAPDKKAARWLTAAAWDRMLMRLGQPQWYGTQFTKDKESDHWQLYKIDGSIVSDEERERVGVPPIHGAASAAPPLHR